jgi:flagellar biosynthetic protein FliR
MVRNKVIVLRLEMEFLPITIIEAQSFFFIMIRISVILFMFPFFSARVIPVLSKAGLALMITIVLFSVINHEMITFPDNLFGVVQFIITELIIGMILGLMVQLFFEGVRMMGQLVGFQTGFAITNILDPQSGVQVSIFSNFAYLVTMAIFLVLNGHHIALNAIKESFEIINVGSLNLNRQIFQKILFISGDMFVIALKIGAPAIAALLFTKVAFALVTKLIPQMNIMIVAFPVQIVIGLIFFGITLNILLRFVENYLGGMGVLLIDTMTGLKG